MKPCQSLNTFKAFKLKANNFLSYINAFKEAIKTLKLL